MSQIGRLVDTAARETWPHEARDFTPWLAENLDHLSDVLGIPLDLEGTEVAVGSFSADILARNSLNDTRVLIENQLETTDHSHLGQILTYLAGLDVHTVVWIATDFREPHVSAIKWLNDHTSEGFSFFGIRLRVVRIGDSPVAPVLDVVVKPNTWERQLHAITAATNEQLSDLGMFRKSFWTAYLQRHKDAPDFGISAVGVSSNWCEPRKDMPLATAVWLGRSKVGVFVRGLRGVASESSLEVLKPHQDTLENVLDTPMNPDMSYGHFFGQRHNINMEDRANWPQAIDWLHAKLKHYVAAIRDL